MNTTKPLLASGYELDLRPESFGELRRSDDVAHDPTALRERLAEDGYLFVPGFFPRSEIQAVRDEVLNRLSERGQLHPDYPVDEAVVADEEIPAEKAPAGVTATRRSVAAENQPLRDVVFGSRLRGFYERLMGGTIAHFDHIWTRVIKPGKGTPVHADAVYMNRGTPRLMTAWIPYGDVSMELGGLMMLEKSHQQSDRIQNYLSSDTDVYCTNQDRYKDSGVLSKNPYSLREKFGGRWLTTEFKMGDFLTFGMTMLHASLDNQSRRYRLSTDTRYQLASEAIDPRWVGPNTEEWAIKNRIGKIC